MTRAIFVVFFLACLAACGSNEVVQDRYYSLVLAAGTATNDNNENAVATVVIGPIQLPSYLGKRRLAMQVGPNRIESAHHHLWAEPLDDAIAKVITRDVAELLDDIDVEREAGRWTANADCLVRIEFDAFHPTNNSQVVTNGRYWIVSENSGERSAFNLTRTLSLDGYAHAVDVLRGTLETLAAQIAEDVHTACTERRHSVGDIPQRLENTRDNALAEP